MGSRAPTLLEIPGTEGVDGGTNQAVQSMLDLMNTQLQGMKIPGLNVGPAQQIAGLNVGPAQQIAGLGANELTTQNLLSKFLGTDATQGEAYKAGMGELQKTLGGEFYDPRTSDFWSGFREQSAIEEEKGVSDIRRRGQLGGGLYATPNQRTEADYLRGTGADRQAQLGGLYENERNRKSNAVSQALGYAGFEEQGITNRLQLGSTIGAIPREIENQRNQAAFNQQQAQNLSIFNQQTGQSAANFAQQQAQNQSVYNQALGQEQSNYATQLAQLGIQGGAAESLMPQWNVDDSDPMGGFLGLLGTIGSAVIGK